MNIKEKLEVICDEVIREAGGEELSESELLEAKAYLDPILDLVSIQFKKLDGEELEDAIATVRALLRIELMKL